MGGGYGNLYGSASFENGVSLGDSLLVSDINSGVGIQLFGGFRRAERAFVEVSRMGAEAVDASGGAAVLMGS